jgi:hypothetical protein
MCEGVWGSVREGENKDPRAIARARGGEHRDVGRERLSTYVERERRGVRVTGEGEGREGRGRCQVTWRRACQHAPSGLAGEASPRTHDGAGLGAKFHLSLMFSHAPPPTRRPRRRPTAREPQKRVRYPVSRRPIPCCRT